MRISVIMASYNHGLFIEQAVRSVLAQTFQDFELVVVDDGSSDDTVSRLMSLRDSLRDERLRVLIFRENRGACIAMNRAIREARGEWIAVLNSDDYFLPQKLQKQAAFLEAHPEVGAVFTYPQMVDERGLPFSEAQHKDFSVFQVENRPRTAWLRHFFAEGNCLCHPTLLVRRSCYEQVGLYDARLAQVPDLDMWIRLCKVYEIHVLPEPLTCFRIRDHQQNASAARPEVVIRDAWERRRLLDHFLNLPETDFLAVFPEAANGAGKNRAHFLAEFALSLQMPFYTAFALDTLYAALPPAGDSPEYRSFIELTGRHDLYGLYSKPAKT